MEIELFIVPEIPDFAPEKSLLIKAEELVWSFYMQGANGVSARLYENRTAAGSTMSIDSLECPVCSDRLDVWSDELDEWWSDFQDVLFGPDDPMTEAVEMPCCGNRPKLDRFDFLGAVRFSRLIIRVDDPCDGDKLTTDQLSQVESLLGCKLVQFTSLGT